MSREPVSGQFGIDRSIIQDIKPNCHQQENV